MPRYKMLGSDINTLQQTVFLLFSQSLLIAMHSSSTEKQWVHSRLCDDKMDALPNTVFFLIWPIMIDSYVFLFHCKTAGLVLDYVTVST